jgi:hypothetical protein
MLNALREWMQVRRDARLYGVPRAEIAEFRSWLRAQEQEIQFHQDTMLGYTNPAPRHTALLRESQGTLDIARNAVADRVSQLGVEIVETTPGGAGTKEEIVIDDHPAALIFQNPGFMVNGQQVTPLHTRVQQMRLVTQYILSVGEAYFLKIRDGALSRVTRRLSIMPAQYIQPIVQQGLVTYYEIRDGYGGVSREPASEVIRIWYPDPENIYRARGAVAPQWSEYDARKFASQHSRSHFERDAIPRVFLEGDAGAQIPEPRTAKTADKAWLAAYNQRHGANRGLPYRTPPGWKAKVLDVTGAETATLGFLEHFDRHLLRALKTPKSVLGDISDAPARAAAETNQYVFDLYAVSPITELIADALTEQWVKPEYGPQYALRFTEFVAKDKEFELKRERQDLETMVHSPDEIRVNRGEEESEWGQYPVGGLGDRPYTGEIPEPITFNEDAGAFGGDDTDGEAESALNANQNVDDDNDDRSRRRSQRPDPSAYSKKSDFMAVCIPHVMAEGKTKKAAIGQCNGMWEGRAVISADALIRLNMAWEYERAREKKFMPLWSQEQSRIFSAQERHLVQALEAAGLGRSRYGRALTQAEVEEIVQKMLDPSRWAVLHAATVDRVRRLVYETAGADAMTLVAAEREAFAITERALLELERAAYEYRNLTTETTRRRVMKGLSKRLEVGAEIDQAKFHDDVIGSVRHSFKSRKSHAPTLGRTGTGTASQDAVVEAWTQSGMVQFKQWHTSLDDAVRDSHQIEGQTVPLDGRFELEGVGVTCRAPLDPELPVEHRINCRCFMTPVTENENG